MHRNLAWLKDLMWTIALAGLVAGVFRLVHGLGSTTNLSDAMPWGLWKILNMVAGVALSTSGFTIGFLYYVLGRERFKPLVKPAILVAFLGYASSCLALLFDIGLPHRFWHPFVMWNPHSFLFEVFWCVMLYLSVTVIELAPTVLERFGAERFRRSLHRIAFGVVVTGISLSCLHHSSLGSLFLVTPLRLHGLWYSPWLPLFFILSAMGGGLMFLVLVKIGHGLLLDRQAILGADENVPLCAIPTAGQAAPGPREPGRDMPLLQSVAAIAAVILGLYTVLKGAELVLSGDWTLLAAGSGETWLWSLEMLLTGLVPVFLVAVSRTRHSPAGLGLAAASATAGLVLNRLNVGIFGYWHDAGQPYFPSPIEWAVGLGVMAAAGLAFLAAAEYLPVFRSRSPAVGRRVFRYSFDSISHVWTATLSNGLHRFSFVAVIVVPLAWAALAPAPSANETADHAVGPPLGRDVQRAVLVLDGDRNGRGVDFPHAGHQQRLGGESSCGTCHHVSLPGDRSTPCFHCHRDMLASTGIFDHPRHVTAVTGREQLSGLQPRNHSCDRCHPADQPKLAATAVGCLECHKQDMWLDVAFDPQADLARAASYQDAMHGNCVACHLKEGPQQERPALGECRSCHSESKAAGDDITAALLGS